MKLPERMSALVLCSLLSATLVACGGGGGSGDSSGSDTAPVADHEDNDNVTATDAQVVALVASSNIQAPAATAIGLTGTWRWLSTPAQHIAVYVPAPAAGNATEQDYAAKTQTSITTINQKLAGLVVLDQVSSIPASGNYIRVSYGTAYVPPGATNYQSYCANVATGPNVGNVISPDASGGIATNPVYINLGNGNCDVTQDIVTHEIGHALGLAGHFSGFGDGPSISTAFWDVLATLYANPPLTTAGNLVVRRAAN